MFLMSEVPLYVSDERGSDLAAMHPTTWGYGLKTG